MRKEIRTNVAIIGAGSAGLYALREVRRARKSYVMIDPGPLGTTCARVGCMPSKTALHAAHLWAAREPLAKLGVDGVEALRLERGRIWAAVRAQRDFFATRATEKTVGGAGEHLIEGRARFVEPTILEVDGPAGPLLIRADAVVIATGSRPVVPDWLNPVTDRVVTTDELFELDALPEAVGVLGAGAIGLEMGLALARLGVRVTAADIAPTVAGIRDPVVAERAIGHFGTELSLWLGKPVTVEPAEAGVTLCSGERETRVDLILAALGRRPNTDGLSLDRAGFELDERGTPVFDAATLQLGNHPVFIAGDANGSRPLMHEAADEGAIAGFNAARSTPVAFRRKVALGIAFSDPDVATVGERLESLDPERIVIGTASGEANGRARILASQHSLLRIYADSRSGRLLGAAIFAAGGEHLAHLLAWSIQRGETAAQLLEMPFYHPVVEEMLQTALQDIVRQLPSQSQWPIGLSPLQE
jgi:dihydrolipoamide dehydrogenase